MKIGTKSVLFGVHQFLLHPWFVAWAWWKLYRFRTVEWWSSVAGLDGERVPLTAPVRTSIRDWRLWLTFFVHDIGYLGKPNMDGPEGELHPMVGANILFRVTGLTPWHHFVLYHSRYLAKADGAQPSPLCIADKFSIALTPAWLYLPLARLSGEIHEYTARAKRRAESGESKHLTSSERARIASGEAREWYAALQSYMTRWVEEHKDGRTDSWTPVRREARDATGVWS